MTNTVFEKIERSYEAKFQMDEEFRFKAHAKRDKKLGLWAAKKMGLVGDEAEAYAKEVIFADLEEPGPDDVIRKVMGDFKAQNICTTEAEVREAMVRFMVMAVKELEGKFPEALGQDHRGANL